jgi:hypothetical protein
MLWILLIYLFPLLSLRLPSALKTGFHLFTRYSFMFCSPGLILMGGWVLPRRSVGDKARGARPRAPSFTHYSFSFCRPGLRINVFVCLWVDLTGRSLSTSHIAPPNIAKYLRSGVLLTVSVTIVAAFEMASSHIFYFCTRK